MNARFIFMPDGRGDGIITRVNVYLEVLFIGYIERDVHYIDVFHYVADEAHYERSTREALETLRAICACFDGALDMHKRARIACPFECDGSFEHDRDFSNPNDPHCVYCGKHLPNAVDAPLWKARATSPIEPDGATVRELQSKSLLDLCEARDSYARILAKRVLLGEKQDSHFFRSILQHFANYNAACDARSGLGISYVNREEG